MGLFDKLFTLLNRKIEYTNWAGKIYTIRYYLIFPQRLYKWPNVVFHYFPNESQDRYMHDHARWCVAIRLTGSYVEHRIDGTCVRGPGCIYLIHPDTQHRLTDIKPGTRTLFLIGYKSRPSRYYDSDTGKLINYDDASDRRKRAVERLTKKTIRGL